MRRTGNERESEEGVGSGFCFCFCSMSSLKRSRVRSRELARVRFYEGAGLFIAYTYVYNNIINIRYVSYISD